MVVVLAWTCMTIDFIAWSPRFRDSYFWISTVYHWHCSGASVDDIVNWHFNILNHNNAGGSCCVYFFYSILAFNQHLDKINTRNE